MTPLSPPQRKPGRAHAAAAAFVLLAAALCATPSTEAAGTPLLFGMDAGSVAAQKNAGVRPDYGVVWAGVWLERSGWGGFDSQIKSLVGSGTTPVVHLYYWGSDISQSCINNGCWSSVHGMWKDSAGWDRLANGLVQHLNSAAGGKPVIVILETEFNQNDARAWDGLDGKLSDKAWRIRGGYSAAQIVLGFGNWGHDQWHVFDRAASASHFIGVQGMRASTRDSWGSYLGVVPALVQGSQKAQQLFGKPVLLTDVALSSYPEPGWQEAQSQALKDLFAKKGDLKAAGVRGLIYRAWTDTATANGKEYYGAAEKHWGLSRTDGTWKPALSQWKTGVQAERAGQTTATSTTSATASGAILAEGESFASRPIGGRMSVPGQSGGAVWNLWSNGQVATTLQLPQAATYEVSVVARGQLMNGVAPHMEVRLDGKWVLAADPGGSGYGTFTARVGADQGPAELAVRFTNDASGGGQDRNLLLDKVTVRKV